MAEPNQSQIVRFGPLEVDLRSGELRKNGVKVKLQHQPLQVQVTLLQHPGDVFTRGQLRQQLRPTDTFVDFEHGLNAAIKRLRDALGESAEKPVFIETLAQRGYRFRVRSSCAMREPWRKLTVFRLRRRRCASVSGSAWQPSLLRLWPWPPR